MTSPPAASKISLGGRTQPPAGDPRQCPNNAISPRSWPNAATCSTWPPRWAWNWWSPRPSVPLKRISGTRGHPNRGRSRGVRSVDVHLGSVRKKHAHRVRRGRPAHRRPNARTLELRLLQAHGRVRARLHAGRGFRSPWFALFNTVGPRQTGRYGMVLPRFVGAALRGEPLPRLRGRRTKPLFLSRGADTVEALRRLQLSRTLEARWSMWATTNRSPSGPRPAGPGTDRFSIPAGGRAHEKAYAAGFEDYASTPPGVAKAGAAHRFRPRRPLDDIIREVADALRCSAGAD